MTATIAEGQFLAIGATSPKGQLMEKRAIELCWKGTILGRRIISEHASNADIRVRTDGLADSRSHVQQFDGAIDDQVHPTTHTHTHP